MENPKMLRCIIYIGYLIHLADCAYHAESGTGTDILYKNEELIPGEKLVSGLYTLELQTDGNLVLYDRRDPMNPSFMIAEDQNPTPIWNTGTVGENVERLVLQRDGNLVLYSDGWVPVWASGTHSPYPYISHLLLSDNGVLGLFCTGNGRLWTNTEGRNESECINERSKLYKNSQLLPGKKLASDNGLYTLEMQADGNLVTYDQNRRAVWRSGTAKLTNVREFLLAGGWHTHEEIMSMSRDDCRNTLIVILHQRNGDSVQALQALSDGDLLERGRRLTPSSRLVLQEDGDLVLYLMGGAAAWRTSTASPWRSVSYLGLGEDGVLTLYCELYSQHHPGVSPYKALWTSNEGILCSGCQTSDLADEPEYQVNISSRLLEKYASRDLTVQACWRDNFEEDGQVFGEVVGSNDALHSACKAQFGESSRMTRAGRSSYICERYDGGESTIQYKTCLTDLRKILIEGGWHTREELMSMSEDDCRNTLISILNHRSDYNINELQSLTDEKLVERSRCLIQSNPSVSLLSDRARREQTGWVKYWEAFHMAQTSTLGVDERYALMKANLPIWVLHPDEEFYPKSFQDYVNYNIKHTRFADDFRVNLRAWNDKRHHYKEGKYNPTKFSENSIPGNIWFEKDWSHHGNYHRLVDPKSAPTYAFFMQRSSTEIWIRYYLFFGINVVPVFLATWDHYADWIHISVKLGKANSQWVPTEYWYSAHSGGEHIDNPLHGDKIQFYDLANWYGGQWHSRPRLFKVTSDQAIAAGEFHPIVFLARGTHEAYATTGSRGVLGTDHCDWGDAVVPWALDLRINLSPGTAAKDFDPYPMWDLGDPVLSTRMNYQAFPELAQIPYIPFEPRKIKGSTEKQDSFFELFTWMEPNLKRYAILNCGQDTDNDGEFGITIPIQKFVDWGDEFDK